MAVEMIIANAQKLIKDGGLVQSRVLPNDQVGCWFNNWKHKNQSPSIKTLQKLADALDCSPAYLMREIIPDRPAPDENQHKKLDILTNNGSGIETVYLLWQEHQGRICPSFCKAMDRIDLWRLSQLYHLEDGLFIYGNMGNDQIRWLGPWAIEAPGNIVGEKDPDKGYAVFTMAIWRDVMAEWLPQRHACLVRSDYGGPRCLEYDGIYLPMLGTDLKPKMLMVAKTMEGLFE